MCLFKNDLSDDYYTLSLFNYVMMHYSGVKKTSTQNLYPFSI